MSLQCFIPSEERKSEDGRLKRFECMIIQIYGLEGVRKVGLSSPVPQVDQWNDNFPLSGRENSEMAYR